MKDEIDRELARRFADLARSDERTAPGFGSVLERASAPVRAHPRLPAAVAAAVSIAAITSILWIQRSRRQEAPADPIASASIASASLSAWRSPTSALLETPGRDLLQGTPALAIPPAASPESFPSTPSAPARARRPLSKGAAS